MTRELTARRDEQGSALVELSWLAIILLVPLIWIVISVFEVQQGAFATSAAARAAGRAYALAPDDATGERPAPRPSYARCWPTRAPPASAPGVTVTCDAPAGNCHVGTSVITVRIDSGRGPAASSRRSSARAPPSSRSTRPTRSRSGSTSRARSDDEQASDR